MNILYSVSLVQSNRKREDMITKKINNSSPRKVVTPKSEHSEMASAFQDFILKENHPCIMAQTVFKMDKVDFHSYSNFGTREAGKSILKDLQAYIENYDFASNEFFTFIAGFEGASTYTEKEFEDLLWQQLQQLHELDKKPWDPEVSDDGNNENFSFSLYGKAFYIVGLHPNSSRMARQSPFPTIVFNLHWQFEKLREMGTYTTVRDRIRERDMELQGSINPMMVDFGEDSEAKQYSGRKVGKDWKCPFHK